MTIETNKAFAINNRMKFVAPDPNPLNFHEFMDWMRPQGGWNYPNTYSYEDAKKAWMQKIAEQYSKKTLIEFLTESPKS